MESVYEDAMLNCLLPARIPASVPNTLPPRAVSGTDKASNRISDAIFSGLVPLQFGGTAVRRFGRYLLMSALANLALFLPP
jgi:hypothetical protein